MGVVIPTEHSDEESKISCFIKGYHVKTSFTSKQHRVIGGSAELGMSKNSYNKKLSSRAPLSFLMTLNSVLDGFRLTHYLRYPSNIR